MKPLCAALWGSCQALLLVCSGPFIISASAQAPPPPPPPPPAPRVIEVRLPDQKAPMEGKRREVQIGGDFIVDVRDVQAFIEKLLDQKLISPDPRESKDSSEKTADNKALALAEDNPDRVAVLTKRKGRLETALPGYLVQMCLFLDGRPYPDLTPLPAEYPKVAQQQNDDGSPRYSSLRFQFRKTAANRDSLIGLLQGRGLEARPTALSIGFNKAPGSDQTKMMESDVDPQAQYEWQIFSINPAPQGQLVFGFLTAIVLVILFVWLAISSDLLRDPTSPLNPIGRYPFSLSRCQMAFWTFLIGWAFLFLWIVIREYNTITNSELTLLGISATTGLGSVFISQISPPSAPSVLTDKERRLNSAEAFKPLREDAEKKLQDKLAEIDAKRKEKDGATDAVKPTLQVQLDTLSATADQLSKRVAELKDRESYFMRGGGIQHFLLDLLQEKDSVDFHRFQMIAWTLVLGGVFGFGVLQQLAMPKFDSTLLALMGISNGTYLGFKWPAAQKGT